MGKINRKGDARFAGSAVTRPILHDEVLDGFETDDSLVDVDLHWGERTEDDLICLLR